MKKRESRYPEAAPSGWTAGGRGDIDEWLEGGGDAGEGPISADRFHFTIKLSDMANLESKTLYFCIRYNVAGQEHWDNNSGKDFQVDFHKKMLPQNGKKGAIGAASRPLNGLPKSTRRQNPSTAPRPKSVPIGVSDFGDSPKRIPWQSAWQRSGTPKSYLFAKAWPLGAGWRLARLSLAMLVVLLTPLTSPSMTTLGKLRRPASDSRVSRVPPALQATT